MITDCLKSGLSISMWCREHDIPVGTFYSWISQVKIVRASARTLARISYEILV
ncbi:MAG: transposase [Lachnospiraceae bacterium]|nr:transposase [Lachnospiraceae bacterium]